MNDSLYAPTSAIGAGVSGDCGPRLQEPVPYDQGIHTQPVHGPDSTQHPQTEPTVLNRGNR